MLLKIEKTILKKVSKQPNCHVICESEFAKYSGEELKESFESLKEKGYFDIVDSTADFSSFSYVLTTKGRFYKEYSRKTFFANIVIPIIVSLLTTIGALYLEKLAENNDTKPTTEYTGNYSGSNF